MNKKIISKYDKCSHLLVYTGAVEKDNKIEYRCGCVKCKLDERVLDKKLDELNKEQLQQRKYILSNNNHIPGINIPKQCSNLNELNKAYNEFKDSHNYNYSEEQVINEIRKQIKIIDTFNYMNVKVKNEYELMRIEHYNFYDSCCHQKVVTGISKKTGEIRYGCTKCMLDERLLDKSRDDMTGNAQIIYDYLASGEFSKYGRKIDLYYPYLGDLHIYYKSLNVPDTYQGYQKAEEDMIKYILIKTRKEDVIIRNKGRKKEYGFNRCI